MKLDNGIPIYFSHKPDCDSTALAIGIRAGSRHEEGPQRGAAHFLEHLLMRGSKHADGNGITERIDSIGGELEPFTTRSWTCVLVQAPGRHATLAAETLFEIVTEPRLDPDDIEAERSVILEEISGLEADPRHNAMEAMHQRLWGDHPLSWPAAGERAHISSVSRDSIRSFHEMNYLDRGNLVVSAVGRFDQDTLLSLADRWLGSLPAGRAGTVSEPLPQHGEIVNHINSEASHIVIGAPAFSRKDSRFPALVVLNELLGSGLSSYWVQSLRGDRGIAYDVGSDIENLLDSGVFYLYAGVNARNADDCIELGNALFDRMAKGDFSKERFIRARERAIGRMQIELDINYTKAWSQAESVLSGISLGDYRDNGISEITSVSFKDVCVLAEQLSSRARVVSSCIGISE